MWKWIDKINSPQDLKQVPLEKLSEVADEYRRFLIDTVAQTGGHLGASLGALELNIALHYVLDSPQDKICWDVGHQAYVHKMITGRLPRMSSLRQSGGLSGFPSFLESPHDPFTVGHAGTAISQALGLAVARDFRKGKEKIVAVVGDGAMTSGLSFEALNNAGHLKKNMLIVLNDNKMAISRNVGAISKYLNNIITNPLYNRVRKEVEKQLERFPRLRKLAANSMEGMKHLFIPGLLFDELGFRYFGPVDGHQLPKLVQTLRKVLELGDCSLLHVVTQKGKGCDFTERDDEKGHGVTPFNVKTGEKILAPVELSKAGERGESFTKLAVEALLDEARKDARIVAITAAMPSGTGLIEFQKKFPDRFFDVGIAEQHAVTFAGALARGGLIPACAIYSTFLQRSYDQLMHDIALQQSPLVLLIDRAGLVGADGATHHGVFDISFLSSIPGAVIAAPASGAEMKQMMALAVKSRNLFGIRYPRANVSKALDRLTVSKFGVGEAETLLEGEDAVLLALGTMVEKALQAAAILREEGVEAAVVNMRFAKPLDGKLLAEYGYKNKPFFTLEEHVLSGGFGARVLEWLEREGLTSLLLHRFALPDEFVEHGDVEKIMEEFGLSPEKIAQTVLHKLKVRNPFNVRA